MRAIDCPEQQDTHGPLGEPIVGFISDDFQQLLDTSAADRGDNPELGKIGAD